MITIHTVTHITLKTETRRDVPKNVVEMSHVTSRHLINLTLMMSTVSAQWKQAYIRPVPKTPTPRQLTDYRPISITPVLLTLHFPGTVVAAASSAIRQPVRLPPDRLDYCGQGCSQDVKSQDRDETETFLFQTLKTETRRDVPKNVSRPSRDRDVQDRDYIPVQ